MINNIKYPMTNPNLKYSVDDFYNVKNNIRDTLGDLNFFSQETQIFFEKMLNNLNFKKKKYNNEEEWRKKKPQQIKKDNLDINEKTYQELKGYLNKISASNYLTILGDINKTLEEFEENKDYYTSQLLEDILKKARTEPNYCIYYVKIIMGLFDKSLVRNFINELKKNYL